MGICSVMSHDRLCFSVGGRYSSSVDLGIRKSIISEAGMKLPLRSRVVNKEFIVGVLVKVIPA